MNSQNPQFRSSNESSFLSIDQWQDSDDLESGSWITNPFSGVFLVVLSMACLFLWGALPKATSSSETNAQVRAHIGDSGIAVTDGAKPWASPEEQPKSPPKPKPSAREISELVEKAVVAEDNRTKLQSLASRHGKEIVLGLDVLFDGLFEESVDAREFASICRLICFLSFQDEQPLQITGEHAKLIPRLAAASKHLTASEIQTAGKYEMKQFINILEGLEPQTVGSIDIGTPECCEFYRKLASVDEHRAFLKLLDKINTQSAHEAGVGIAKDLSDFGLVNYRPNLRNSEAAAKFVWAGKLSDQPGFEDVRFSNSEASLKTFAKLATAKLSSAPKQTVAALMILRLSRKDGFERDSLPQELLQKADHALSPKVEEYLTGNFDKDSLREARNQVSKGVGPYAFLEVAAHLGGAETALAILKMGKNDPSIFENFSLINDVLLSVNEPAAYDAIAKTIAAHSLSTSQVQRLHKNVGNAIEPACLELLQATIEKAKGREIESLEKTRIHRLLVALQKIGTASSYQLLSELQERSSLRNFAGVTLKKIKQRESEK